MVTHGEYGILQTFLAQLAPNNWSDIYIFYKKIVFFHIQMWPCTWQYELPTVTNYLSLYSYGLPMEMETLPKTFWALMLLKYLKISKFN